MSSEITIPMDVLCDIFHLLCNAPIALHDLKNESHFHEFPWAVGQVCRHWRGAFLSHTPLWTSFALQPGTFSGAYFAEMNRRATIYLDRSGQRPLTVVVSMLCSGTENFPKTVWRMLLSCLKRWKRANLVLGGGAALDELLRCRGYMSSLESLRMSISSLLPLKHYDAFQVSPHLTELDLAHPEYVAAWQFPWAQLTMLKLEASWEEFNNDSNNLWGILFQLENIEELHIIITTFGHVRPPSPLPIIRLPRLQFLEISLAFAMMLSWFTAPLLEDLHIRGYYIYDYFYHQGQPYEREIISLIQRSSCHIRRLALEMCGLEEIIIMVKTLSSVEELLIINNPSFLVIMGDISGLDDIVYLPKLKILRVKYIVTRNRHESNSTLRVLENAVTSLSRLLEVRGKGLSLASHDVIPLEKFELWLTLGGQCPAKLLEVMQGWPSPARVYINGLVLEQLTPTPSL